MTWSAQLFKSADAGSTYDQVLVSRVTTVIGKASGVLGNFSGGNVFDNINTIDVTLQSGKQLLNYSELQVLNGSGLFVLGAHQRWEVLQYKNATLVGVNTYRLASLLRGRRGTEWAMSLHQATDIFALVSLFALNRSNPGTSEIGLNRLYKGVTAGSPISGVLPQSFANTAVGLECYSPVHLKGERDGSNNLAITWTRRTRIGGEWRDYVDVPNGENSLLFDVEIWDSGYTTLLRTFSSLTSETVVYTAANQTTDGTTPGNPVYVRVYQISQTVGRGYKVEGTL